MRKILLRRMRKILLLPMHNIVRKFVMERATVPRERGRRRRRMEKAFSMESSGTFCPWFLIYLHTYNLPFRRTIIGRENEASSTPNVMAVPDCHAANYRSTLAPSRAAPSRAAKHHLPQPSSPRLCCGLPQHLPSTPWHAANGNVLLPVSTFLCDDTYRSPFTRYESATAHHATLPASMKMSSQAARMLMLQQTKQ